MCPILYKGAEVKYQNEKARSPAIYIDKKNRKVQAYFTTTANGTKSDVNIRSYDLNFRENSLSRMGESGYKDGLILH